MLQFWTGVPTQADDQIAQTRPRWGPGDRQFLVLLPAQGGKQRLVLAAPADPDEQAAYASGTSQSSIAVGTACETALQQYKK